MTYKGQENVVAVVLVNAKSIYILDVLNNEYLFAEFTLFEAFVTLGDYLYQKYHYVTVAFSIKKFNYKIYN